jgi:hypothetical protein
MGNTTENKFTGKIIGHTVKFLPKKVDHRGSGITITKAEKIGAFVTIQVDDKKTYTVPSKETELVLENQEPTEETRALVYNTLTERHPFNSERSFREFVTPKGKGSALRRYELEE